MDHSEFISKESRDIVQLSATFKLSQDFKILPGIQIIPDFFEMLQMVLHYSDFFPEKLGYCKSLIFSEMPATLPSDGIALF